MLIIGIAGLRLTDDERAVISAPSVSGVILFTRNFADHSQLAALVAEIRSLRPGAFLLCIDQEGGPVQRLRNGFTPLPALARIGALIRTDRQAAVDLSEEHAWLMASEMRAFDIDLSFAPVLDLRRGNRAIGDRAFHADPEVVSELGMAYIRGMRMAGMAATIKHFPGHGSVLEDTHFDVAIDSRPTNHILEHDVRPFIDAINAGAEAVMMAHVVYPAVDIQPAGYSRVWIEDVLRAQLGFRGVVFSDDIGMVGGASIGAIDARIRAHLQAGCDLVLVCNPELVANAILAVADLSPCDDELVAMLQGKLSISFDELQDNPQRLTFIKRVLSLPTLES